ncbi:hypothetical protein B4N84_19610 [Flavobacterium sp. IR1]|nr:hypothetical protein B4N84_19610 [Flavobacterium sp. IR1]
MKKRYILFILTILSYSSFSQSKAVLKQKIKELEVENSKNKLNWQIDVEKNISKSVIEKTIPNIEDGGWRLEKNTTQYKTDLIGQLGSLWIIGTDKKMYPQGGISLEKYKIVPVETKPTEDYLYKKFISNKTNVEGGGGTPVIAMKASLNDNEYSDFTITVEGTSQIIPEYDEFSKIRRTIIPGFNLQNGKALYLCTGMHVIKYSNKIYKSTEMNASVTSPVVNIGGTYYSESSAEKNEYVIYRQLTLIEALPTTALTTESNQLITLADRNTTTIENTARTMQSTEILVSLLKREPTFEEITKFQENPNIFIKEQLGNNLSEGQQILLKSANEKAKNLPQSIEIFNNIN